MNEHMKNDVGLKGKVKQMIATELARRMLVGVSEADLAQVVAARQKLSDAQAEFRSEMDDLLQKL